MTDPTTELYIPEDVSILARVVIDQFWMNQVVRVAQHAMAKKDGPVLMFPPKEDDYRKAEVALMALKPSTLDLALAE